MSLTANIAASTSSPDHSVLQTSAPHRIRWFSIVLAIVCTAVFGGGLSAGPAQAEGSDGPTKQLGQELSQDQANSLATDVDLQSASESGEKVDTSTAKAWELDDGNVYVNYSFEGDVEGVSNIGAVVSPEGKVVATAEIIMKASSANSGHVEAWTNGEKTADREVTSDDVASSEISAQGGGFWSKLNDCLSSQGVASWVVAGLGVACSAVCVGTAGAGCVACIAAAAGVTGGAAGYCVDRAQK